MQPQAINYHTYMLRVWSEPQVGHINGEPQWRFSLCDTVSGEQWGFTTLEALSNFLEELFPNEELLPINAESTLVM